MIVINILVAIGISIIITLIEHLRQPTIGTLKSITDEDGETYLILELDNVREMKKIHGYKHISLRVDSASHN